jgi:hypothetical protein
MSPSRHALGTGLRPRRDASLVADAQRRFRAAAAGLSPDLSPQGRGEPAARAGRARPTALSLAARVLYEAGVVPVAALARLIGVHERTLYKHAVRGGWRRRYAGRSRKAARAAQAPAEAAAAAQAPAGRSRTARGAGGRFVRGTFAGAPHRCGLKALDPEGEAQALSACARAAELSDRALARAIARRDGEADARTLALVVRALRDLAAIVDRGRDGERRKPRRARAAGHWEFGPYGSARWVRPK